MSVAGIDFGSKSNVVALARRKGIDVVMNEESKRETPSLINFGDKQRFVGCAAGDKINMQPTNTVACLKRLIGKKFSDPTVQEDIKEFLYPVKGDKKTDNIIVTVEYMGKQREFSPEQLLGMILSDLKRIAELDNEGIKITDCVLSVPIFFDDVQRRAMIDAASICGLNVMRLMHETTATALAYGIFKTQEFTEKPVRVAFVDIGHSAMQCSVVEFTSKGLKVLSTGYDTNLGGGAFDNAMFHHFCEEFKEKFKIDVKSNPRASFRLKSAIEKTKKVLSANPEAPINIECLMNDVDVRSMITRDKMEELAQNELNGLMGPVRQMVVDAKLDIADIASVELVGNASRIQSIQKALEDFFQKPISRTLNASESVARGCALQGAMLSPLFRVREFDVIDAFAFPVKMSWPGDAKGEVKDVELFEKYNPIPSTKQMTFLKAKQFTVQATTKTDESSEESSLGTFDIGPLPAVPKGKDKHNVKLKVKLNLNGLVECTEAQVWEEYEEEVQVPIVEEPKKTEGDASEKMETEGGEEGGEDGEQKEEGEEEAAKEEEPEETKPKFKIEIKKKTKKTDVPIKSTYTGGLPDKVLEKCKQEEFDMALQDKVMEETKERKNAVEAYVYSMRSKLEEGGQLFDYVKEDVRTSFKELLNNTKDWLYEDGEDETKGVYVKKLEELSTIGNPIEERYNEEHKRPGAIAALESSCQMIKQTSQDEAHAHIDAEDLKKVQKECDDAAKWLAEKVELQSALQKTDDCVLKSEDIEKKRSVLERFATPILSRPKPKPKPKKEEKKEKKEGEEEEKLDGDAEMEDGDAGAAAAEGEDAPMEEDAKPAAGSAEDLD
ncbi:unnamed protein product [Bathycoccus prasinos]